MDLSKKILSPNSGRSDSQRKSSKNIIKISHESNENSFTPHKTSTRTHISKNEPKSLKSPSISPSSQKRILAEKNNFPNSFKKSTPQRKTDKPIHASPNGSMPDSPYNPVSNYTSLRPEFLRYDPNRKTEIMLRVEKAMLDEEEEHSLSTSSISSYQQVPVEKAMQEEEPQMPVCEEETCVSDEDEEEGISHAKLALKLVFFLVCLVSSVYYICSMSSNVEIKLHSRKSEVNVLSEMVGLSEMCLSRRNVELTCGIEERVEVPVEIIIPKEVDTVKFSSGELEVEIISNDGMKTDIGLLAQENIVESPELELHAEGDYTQILRSSMKVEVYLLYSMYALGCLSVLVAMVVSLHSHIGKKVYKKKKQNRVNELPASETAVKRARIGGKSNMHVIQPPQVELLGEFSLNSATMVEGSSVEEMELQAKKVTDATGSSFKEVELQADLTEHNTTPGTFFENIKENKNQGEAIKTRVTTLRRSSRVRKRLASP